MPTEGAIGDDDALVGELYGTKDVGLMKVHGSAYVRQEDRRGE